MSEQMPKTRCSSAGASGCATSCAAPANGRPRLSVFRSSQHIYAQIIDDAAGRTLAAASTPRRRAQDEPQDRRRHGGGERGRQAVAERAKAAGVERVVFDRGGYLFHGRVKALADAAREGGLDF